MVYDLSSSGRQFEITIDFVIIERADTGCPQSKRLSGKIQAVANSTGFKMHIAIATVAEGSCTVVAPRCPRLSTSVLRPRRNGSIEIK